MLSRRGAVLSLFTILTARVESQARPLEGRYFVVVWACQGPSGSPTESHTFASFYRGDFSPRAMFIPPPSAGFLQLVW